MVCELIEYKNISFFNHVFQSPCYFLLGKVLKRIKFAFMTMFVETNFLNWALTASFLLLLYNSDIKLNQKCYSTIKFKNIYFFGI